MSYSRVVTRWPLRPRTLDIAFQIDGGYKQQPYGVWLDEDVECILAGKV